MERLPQKAGFPQEHINEVHGSWCDPSNSIIKHSGKLKNHECCWMVHEARTADLVLVVGTSLGGLIADQVATLCADRTLRGLSLGMVLINLQRTAHDDKVTLRLFGKSDDILNSLLLSHLAEVRLPQTLQPALYAGDRRILVPYDARGHLLDSCRMW
jgi:NAD-dependent SIR2 family protein deacetylase